jgi:alginate O-acetyltransferase complex protein AlgI
VLPILVLGVVVYLAGLTRRRSACVAAGGTCVAALLFYKYTQFLCLSVVGTVWGEAGQALIQNIQPLVPVAPPLALSFFVFEYLHYLFEVGRGSEPMRSPFDFWLFSLFWPSIVAGPVKRYRPFLEALDRGVRSVSEHDVASGLVQVAVGLVKKLVADNLTAYISYHDSHFAELPLSLRWLVLLAIGWRILLDFSGYSDMAIGLARMLGVPLPRNFNWPYLALSIRDFWQRWHISLSLWIRDYIYIPLGGSRHGVVRKVCGVLVAFGICGLWHGAAWNFLFWGLYHGVGLAISSSYRSVAGAGGRWLAGWFGRNPDVAWALTMVYVHVGWLFFFYPLGQAAAMSGLLFGVS